MTRILLIATATAAAALAATEATNAEARSLSVAGVMAIAAGLLVLSAFFSGSETALFSLQPLDRRTMSERNARPVEALLERPRRTLASLLIGNEFVNVLLSTVTAGLVMRLFPDRPWINIVVLTPLLLLFGEVLPKTLALQLNRRVAPLVAPPLLIFARVVTPLRWVITRIADAALVLTGGTRAAGQAAVREAHLRVLVAQGRKAGAVLPMEEEMIKKVFDFGDLTVSRLMTPRPDVFSLSLATDWPDLIDQIRDHSCSRVPIWEGRPDNIIGILLIKELLPHLATRFRDGGGEQGDPRALPLTPRQIHKLLHPAHFVPTTKRAEDMLADFREHRFHLAMVVDEHGNVVGLVTLDDLLAELVGELLDESDEHPEDVTEVVDGVSTVRGNMDVDDFHDHFGVELPEGDYDTLAGFLLHQVGSVPALGDEIEWQGLQFTVRGIEGQRITEVRVDVPDDVTPPASEVGGEG